MDFWDEMKRLNKEFNSLFEKFNSDMKVSKEYNDYKTPESDMWEDDKEITAEIELPGMDKKDIKINLTEDKLEIKAEKKTEDKKENKKKRIYGYEQSYSGYYQSFSLPKNADVEHAKADYEKGVLKITIPRTGIESKKKRVLELK